MSGILDEQIRKNFLGLGIMMLVLTGALTVGRFYSRWLRRLKFGIDDWLALGGVVAYWAEVGVHFWGLFGAGLGKHIENATTEEITTSYKQLTTIEFPYMVALTLIRTSIAVLLLRVFSAAPWFRWSIYVAVFLNVSWGLFIMFDAFFICTPFSFNWDETIPGGHCADKTTHFIVMAVWSVVNDIMLWTLPQVVVWRLQMDLTQKVVLSAVFALGIFDVVVGIVRIVALSELTPPPGDWTHSLGPVEIWSFIESGVVIVIANIPLCKPVAERLLPQRLVSYAKGIYGRSSYGKSRSKGKPVNTIGGGSGRRWEDDEYQLFPTKGTEAAISSKNTKPPGDIESGSGREWQTLGDQDSLDHDGIRMTHHVTVTEEPTRR